jgi:uncharacterized protein (DUF849 family)
MVSRTSLNGGSVTIAGQGLIKAVGTVSVLAGGNVRVGLEDNLWLDKGVLATNAQLVERAVSIISNMGARVITPAEVRAKLKLEKRAPLPR